jgi:hypothetical protein
MSQATINNRLKIIGDLQDEMRKLKSHYQESLENDPEYQEVQEKAKAFKSEVKSTQEKVKSKPTLRNMDDKVKEIRDEISDHREMLAQEFADYYKETGNLKFTDNEGNEKRIVFSVKIVTA